MGKPFKIAEVCPDTGRIITNEFFSLSEVSFFCANKKKDLVKLDHHLPIFSHLVKEGLKELEEIWRKATDYFREIE